MINHKNLEGGPCEVDLGEEASSVSKQLWPTVNKIITQANHMMTPLLELACLTDGQKSPVSRTLFLLAQNS